ncbi:MAG: 3-dehydroquinate synthase [Chloroflexota bacterium]|nr:3-dehydroquinate synthase [Dehalococcoidia bacterium]MDW8253241.1 3-dehydroquinate synthase [Chloroflexota bacterium]
MVARDPRNIVLTGFSTTGKSTAGRIAAARLGFEFLDTDAIIEARAGRPIAALFAQEGEAWFRDLESAVLLEALSGSRRVIATGGGAILRQANREAMRAQGMVVALEAGVEAILQRLEREQEGSRPLLAGEDPAARVSALKRERAPLYAEADWIVQTDHLSPEAVAAEIVRAWNLVRYRIASPSDGARAVVTTGSASYPLYVGAGILARVGPLIREWASGAVWVLADARAAELYGEQTLRSLHDAGLTAALRVIPSGEASKDLGVAGELYRWLAAQRAERRDVIVALGGGVTGDLAGFVAATFLRGLALVHVPTTLLAMTDSAIGGKTGVNLPEGKNLVGAFHQPRLVVADVEVLRTLPEREYRAGWAETIKHALIRDPELLALLERHADRLLAHDRDLLVDVIGRSMAVKAEVVSLDEREDGLRMILNYGHTAGHALEAAGNYETLLHGEAIAVGMAVAAALGEAIGVTPPALVKRQNALIARFGLPLRAPVVPFERVLAALAVDKKVRGKRNRWILLEEAGRTTIRDDVPPDLVVRVLREVMA